MGGATRGIVTLLVAALSCGNPSAQTQTRTVATPRPLSTRPIKPTPAEAVRPAGPEVSGPWHCLVGGDEGDATARSCALSADQCSGSTCELAAVAFCFTRAKGWVAAAPLCVSSKEACEAARSAAVSAANARRYAAPESETLFVTSDCATNDGQSAPVAWGSGVAMPTRWTAAPGTALPAGPPASSSASTSPPLGDPSGPTCTKGCRCGKSCIACSKVCHK